MHATNLLADGGQLGAIAIDELVLVTEDGVADELIDAADIDSPVELDLDVAGARPQFNLGIDVQSPCILRGPHVDCGVRQGVHLDLLTGQALGIPDNKPLRSEDGGVAEGPESRPGLLVPHEQLADISGDRNLRQIGRAHV